MSDGEERANEEGGMNDFHGPHEQEPPSSSLVAPQRGESNGHGRRQRTGLPATSRVIRAGRDRTVGGSL